MDLDIVIYLWAGIAGAAGGFGRFLRQKNRKWRISFIFPFVVVGALISLIVIGIIFKDNLWEQRKFIWSLSIALGLVDIEIALLIQGVLNSIGIKVKLYEENNDIKSTK